MEPDIRSAQEELDDYGFESSIYNDGDNDTVCHVIGHKQIYANINNSTNGGNDNDRYLGVLEGIDRNESIGVYTDNDSSRLRTDDFVGNVYFDSRKNSGTFQNTLSSDGANNTNDMRTLVVVDIRGTLTNRDWVTDIGAQINPDWGSFDAGMEIILKSLYHGTGDTENCKKCNGNSNGCAYCKGYIPFNNISNPIFLVTGHSLGAAVANLVANHLDSCEDTNCCSGSRTVDDVYAYTFATPKTVKNKQGNEYQNIFNILNNNDVVPLVPTNILALNWGDNGWTRHGRDFHITMPLYLQMDLLKIFDSALLGLGGHAMSTYSHWLEKLPGMLNKKAEDITTAEIQ